MEKVYNLGVETLRLYCETQLGFKPSCVQLMLHNLASFGALFRYKNVNESS